MVMQRIATFIGRAILAIALVSGLALLAIVTLIAFGKIK